MDVRELTDPAQIHGCAGVDQQHHVIEVIVQILQDLQLYRIGFQVGLALVRFNVSMVVHGAGHVAALTHDAAEHEHRDRAFHGVQQTGFALHHGKRAFIDGEILVIAEVH